jgi:dolichol-phosphate mannosyltransferase
VGESFEIVLVDDGSQDTTWCMIAKFAARDDHVVGVLLSRNHGHQIALSAGLEICSGDRILTIDADLQDPPELLGDMMRLMDQGYDVVWGQRVKRHGETAFKKASAALFYRLLRHLTAVPIPPDSGDFRLMSRRVVDVLVAMPERHRFVRGMVSWTGFRQGFLTYERQERHAGITKYPLGKMGRLAVDAITSFSTEPLRLASYLGTLGAVLGFVLLLYVLISWISGDAISGWASVMTAIIILGSMQLTLLGILGEYLGRLFIESKQRPLYIVQQILRRSKSEFSDQSAGVDEAAGMISRTGQIPDSCEEPL